MPKVSKDAQYFKKVDGKFVCQYQLDKAIDGLDSAA